MKSISSDPRGAALAMWARGYSVYYIARARRGRELDHHGKLVTLDVQRHGCLNHVETMVAERARREER